ncbi:MAG: DUF1257 domain-containing protein [Planctomycetes bacterium]|nr:DUF1257 domain-containing protein [Planctomycetota bacterium]
MSSVILVTPLIIANWSVISAAVLGACGAMGFTVASGAVSGSGRARSGSSVTRAEIEVENSEVLAGGGGTDEEMVVEKDGVRATFSRDARGALKVCMEGTGYSKGQLKQIGQELMEQVTQQYVYHRVVTELKERGMPIVHEEVEADRTVKIRVRNW